MTRAEFFLGMAAKDSRFAAYLPDGVSVGATKVRLGPCVHVGSAVIGFAAPDLLRAWHACDHPRRIALAIAEVVCACRGCGTNCPGYEPED